MVSLYMMPENCRLVKALFESLCEYENPTLCLI